MTSIIIDECSRSHEFVTAYFYCRDTPEKNTCVAAYKGLLAQLLAYRRELLPHCIEMYIASGETTLGTEKLAIKFLELFLQDIPKLYIVVDGLDECDMTERQSLMDFLSKFVDRCDAHEPGKLRVLFVSQGYSDIKKTLANAAVISMSAADNKADIEAYVDIWACKIKEKHDLDQDHVEYIQFKTCAQAHGKLVDSCLDIC